MAEEYEPSRILSKSEIAQLDNLLVPHLSKKYPNFKKWLEKTKEEIGQGIRFAFGKWDSESGLNPILCTTS